MIVSQFYALRGAEEDWNSGTVTLGTPATPLSGQDTAAAIRRLCRQHRDMAAPNYALQSLPTRCNGENRWQANGATGTAVPAANRIVGT